MTNAEKTIKSLEKRINKIKNEIEYLKVNGISEENQVKAILLEYFEKTDKSAMMVSDVVKFIKSKVDKKISKIEIIRCVKKLFGQPIHTTFDNRAGKYYFIRKTQDESELDLLIKANFEKCGTPSLTLSRIYTIIANQNAITFKSQELANSLKYIFGQPKHTTINGKNGKFYSIKQI